MGLIITAVAGLIVWLVLWGIGAASGFDAILISIGMVLLAVGVHSVLPYLPGRR
ncbi:MAG TPA: hypothetical protein VMD09_14045 [Solirubrobacteraceae bacterium]|nr:hypothetical protein [Solirubrobacteraceae bacterium]